jgi:rSAM/selenodomain-associated transferase 1
MTTAIGVMARAPSTPGKSRLAPHIVEPRLRELRAALLADTLLVVSAAPHTDPFLFCTPDDRDSEVAGLAGRPMPVIAQGAGDLGDRMKRAFRRLLGDRGYPAAILIGTDIPLLTVEHLAEASRLLRTRDGTVLGPADDGGYYLIGMTAVHERLFDGMAWGSDRVLLDTMAAADRLGVPACLVRGAYDIDTIEDLRRLERDLAREPADTAPNTRRWLELSETFSGQSP